MPQVRNGMVNEARITAQAVIERLDSLIERVEQQSVRENFTYVQRVMTVPAGDTAVEDRIPIPPGVIWRIRRVAITGGINGGFGIYLSEAQPQNLLDGEFANTAMAAWAPGGDGLYIPAGLNLVLRFFTQPAGQVCTVNLRITELKVEE